MSENSNDIDGKCLVLMNLLVSKITTGHGVYLRKLCYLCGFFIHNALIGSSPKETIRIISFDPNGLCKNLFMNSVRLHCEWRWLVHFGGNQGEK